MTRTESVLGEHRRGAGGQQRVEHSMGKTMAGQELLIVRCLRLGVANKKLGKGGESSEQQTMAGVEDDAVVGVKAQLAEVARMGEEAGPVARRPGIGEHLEKLKETRPT